MSTLSIPCTLMRAGTSRGPFFLREWLPEDPLAMEQALIGAIGASDPLQLDGLGGGSTLNSKVAIVSRSKEPGCDLDYLFAQVGVGHRSVDLRPNCGNMLSGVVPFAIEQGLIEPAGDRTTVRVFNVNTRAKIDVTVCTPGGRLTYEGDTRIDGVAGTAAPVLLGFLDCWGSVTGKLFPTGNRIDVIDGTALTCIDAAMPLMIVRARDLGVERRARPAELDGDEPLLAKLEGLRRAAGARMGLGDVSKSVVPKPVLVSEGDDSDSITSRYFTPHRCHSSHAVTGAIGVATAFALPGTVASGIERASGAQTLAVLHPEGRIEVEVAVVGSGAGIEIERAALLRTARKIMEGRLTLPAYVFPQAENSRPGDAHDVASSTAQPRALDIVVPTGVGGANHAVAHLLARALPAGRYGSVRIDNRAGANGTVACSHVRSAAPDGRTLLLGYTATHAIHPAWETVGYDPIRDFAPVGAVCASPLVLVAAAASALQSLDDVMQAARLGTRRLRYAASGRGTLTQLAAELFGNALGARFEGLMSSGSAPALADTMHGHADFMFASLYSALPYLRRGSVRALAIAHDVDEPLLAAVPTLSQAGLDDLDVAQWYGLFAPARTPTGVIETINRDLNDMLGRRDVVDRLRADGAQPMGGSPTALASLLAAESNRWRRVIDALQLPTLAETVE